MKNIFFILSFLLISPLILGQTESQNKDYIQSMSTANGLSESEATAIAAGVASDTADTLRLLIGTGGSGVDSLIAHPSPYSYVIEKISGTIYARPGINSGLQKYSGADLKTVINAAIAALPDSSGHIIIGSSINDSVNAPIVDGGKHYVRITGSPGHRLIWKSYTDNHMFYLTGVKGWTLEGLNLDGNWTKQVAHTTDPAGICFQGCTDILVTNCRIYNFQIFGVYGFQTNTHCGVTNCVIYNCGWNGITFYDGNRHYACWNDVSHVSDVAISIFSDYALVDHNFIHDLDGTTGSNSAKWAIAVEAGSVTSCYGIYSNNMIQGPYGRIGIAAGDTCNLFIGNYALNVTGDEAYSGQFLDNGANNRFINNTITSTDNDPSGIQAGDRDWIEGNDIRTENHGIFVSGKNDVTVINNKSRSTDAYGLRILGAGCLRTTVAGNDFYLSAGSVNNDAATTIFGLNKWHDGTYDNTIP